MGPSVGGMETNTIRMEGEVRPSSNLHPKLPDNIDPKHSLSLGPDRFHQVLKLESPGYSLPTNQSSSQACRGRWLDNTFSSDNYADEAVSYDNAADYPDLSLLLRLLGYVPFPLNGGEAGALTNPRTVKSRRETPEEMKNVRVRWRDRGAESCFLHSRGNGTFSCRPTENVYGCGNDLGVDPR
ncbi:hypothetical protein HZH66_011036 [Vespula vulgaris]|uniref:Uncharacterized protein n=1 Tax=Vespula vulgaris TaxID=7454 RepID=A0A834MWU5_VESVU|nr:hypothetical protein HZH66_011036 [Vespula vulgaris]